MHPLATTFRAILAGIQAVIGTVVRKDRTRDAVLAPIYFHLSRTIQRFEKLVAHWRNNTLPKPAPTPKPAKNPWLALPPGPPALGIVVHRPLPATYPPNFSKAR